MKTFKDEEVVMNFKLLKRTRTYHMINSSCNNICNWNVYLISVVSINLILQCLPILVLMGLIERGFSVFDIIEIVLIIFVIIYYYLAGFILIRIVKKREIIWNLLTVTKFNFLTSKICLQNINILHTFRTKTILVTNIFTFLVVSANILWAIFPVVLNIFTMKENENRPMQNIFNFPYPLKPQTYNRYYIVFYILEVLLLCSVCYIIVLMDIILLSIYYTLIGQYKVIFQSFKSMGMEDKSQKGKMIILQIYNSQKNIIVVNTCEILMESYNII